jgi:hypothetical protein
MTTHPRWVFLFLLFMSTRKDNEKFERYLEASEHGASSIQCFLASQIISDSSYPNRMIEGLKWVLISKYLGDELASDSIIDFLTRGMSESDINQSFDLAEEWIKSKTEMAQDPRNDPHKLDWTKELQDITGLTERKGIRTLR